MCWLECADLEGVVCVWGGVCACLFVCLCRRLLLFNNTDLLVETNHSVPILCPAHYTCVCELCVHTSVHGALVQYSTMCCGGHVLLVHDGVGDMPYMV